MCEDGGGLTAIFGAKSIKPLELGIDIGVAVIVELDLLTDQVAGKSKLRILPLPAARAYAGIDGDAVKTLHT